MKLITRLFTSTIFNFHKQHQADIREKKKKKARHKQHHEAQLLLTENYSFSSSVFLLH